MTDQFLTLTVTCAGYHLGVLNTALFWLTKDLHLDFVKEGAIVVSAVLVGAVVGSLFSGQAADALGPKKALLINNAWLVVGCILCAATPGGYWGLLAGMPASSTLRASPGPCAACLCSLGQLPHQRASHACRAPCRRCHFWHREGIGGHWGGSSVAVRTTLHIRGVPHLHQRRPGHPQPGKHQPSNVTPDHHMNSSWLTAACALQTCNQCHELRFALSVRQLHLTRRCATHNMLAANAALRRRSSAWGSWWLTWWACPTSTTRPRPSPWGARPCPGGASCSSSASSRPYYRSVVLTFRPCAALHPPQAKAMVL